MTLSDYRGARGSNTGDDFHELWATRHAIRLLSNDDDLEALAVEGLAITDETGAPEATWDGVDCTLYFGGLNAKTAHDVVIEQLKYSGSAPNTAWTVSRLVGHGRRDQSVINRMAKAWKGLADLRPGLSVPTTFLVSNQPVDPEVVAAFSRAAAEPLTVQKKKPKETAAAEIRLSYATALNAEEFQAFSAAVRFECGAGSRFALEERVLRAISDWTDHDVQVVVTRLRQHVRQRMRPEFSGELITRASMMLHFGASEGTALFPCPPEISRVETMVSRGPVRDAIKFLLTGTQYICLHGGGGVGKTTALQEIRGNLPAGSIMIQYDCYGGGRYLDPSALRHRATDAFLQLTNELASSLQLPLLLSRYQGSDYPRLFANRLRHAAGAVAAQHIGALIVIAIDAADNAVTAAQSRSPEEASFIHDFVLLSDQPENVRFVVTTRTGRLERLKLSTAYKSIQIEPFNRPETAENVRQKWSAPEPWIDDFHHLSGGVPRVQRYAFQVDGADPSTALDRLRPAGKSLDDVFRQQFNEALNKSGAPTQVKRLCAGLIALPRPVPLSDLAGVLGETEALLADVCTDLSPGIRLHAGLVGFADEDFEHFVRSESSSELADVQKNAATWLLSRVACDRYAALNVAVALVSAGRGIDLLDLVEQEPAPMAVKDPILRREAELQRLRLAIKVCREARDVPRALRFVLIGAESIKTEAVLRDLLVRNPDMAANFAQETAGRLILSDPDHIGDHGPLLFQKLSVDAFRKDAISVREGERLLHAWLQLRGQRAKETQNHNVWDISISDIASGVGATLMLEGVDATLKNLNSWSPKHIALDVAFSLPLNLIAEGHADSIKAVVVNDKLGSIGKLLLLLPLVLAGHSVDINLIARGLEKLSRPHRLKLKHFFDTYQNSSSAHGLLADTALTACEILANKGIASDLVDKVLDAFLAPNFRGIEQRHAHEPQKLDLLFRAHALREARAGRQSSVKDIFEPRATPPDPNKQRQAARNAEEHDRSLLELSGAVYSIYVAVAEALVNRKNDSDQNSSLRLAVDNLAREAWKLSRQHESVAMRGYVAKNLLVLLATNQDTRALKQFAEEIHDGDRPSHQTINTQLFARLSLRHELHDSLLQDLIAAAAATQKMRIGAIEKSHQLVNYARLIKPISLPDANAIFNNAVEVASELDREVMAQIRLLNTLTIRGTGVFPNARSTARLVANVVADAAIRLDGDDHFPWDESMSAIVRLDCILALSNAARWDDENIVRLRETLPPLLKVALGQGTLSPTQVSAIALFSDGNHGISNVILEQAAATALPKLPELVEEMAYDVLFRVGEHRDIPLTELIAQYRAGGTWSSTLLRQECFIATLPSEPMVESSSGFVAVDKAEALIEGQAWDQETLIDSSLLRLTINTLKEAARAERSYLVTNDILLAARTAVVPRNRVAHLSALAELQDLPFAEQVTESLLHAIDAWWDFPAVKTWCRAQLADQIVARLPGMANHLQYGKDNLSPALKRTGMSEDEIQELLLRGIERHVDGFDSDLIFLLAGMIGEKLRPTDAVELANWYAVRLASRIPPEHQDQAEPGSPLAQDANEAVARFLFAYMGDYDLRMRWKAAHAARRLARTGDEATLKALAAQYGRRDEETFRSRNYPFYWLAARLWFTIAWDRIAGECPQIVSNTGEILLQIALDESFPHLLVRSFARDACEKLVRAGYLALTPQQTSNLQRVNETMLTKSRPARTTRRHFDNKDQVRRFKFDPLDTLPSWYQPLLNAFADVDGEQLLQTAERWIIDQWGYSGDVRSIDKDRRRGRFADRDWSLTSNRHGSIPTLERFNNHLEWHAMWCAAGELLVSAPLAIHDDDECDPWDSLGSRIKRHKLYEQPLWAADLRIPVPTIERNWIANSRTLINWVSEVEEEEHRAELYAVDQTEYLVVDSETVRRSTDRIETVNVSSALVDNSTGSALLRALQTVDSAWDYKLPDEDGDQEIDTGPYRLIGWIKSARREEGIDDSDTFRGHASTIVACPGRRVSEACNLNRDASGSPLWFDTGTDSPMFIYEVWGERDKDDDPYATNFHTAGRRLLAHKTQLQEFLRNQGLDLIIEVEVTRRGRQTRQYTDEEEKNPEGHFDRLYRLHSGGDLEVAEGRISTWTNHCPGIKAP